MILSDSFKNKKYAVLGLGKSGLTAAEALLKSGADVLVFDDKDAAMQAAAAKSIPTGNLETVDASTFDALVMSPGIPHTHPAPHPVAAHFKAAGKPLLCDVALLHQAKPDATYVGITGTNGKSTTTALIAHILKQAGKSVDVGGNLGMPALTLAPLGADGTYVLEMSSYQLELVPDMAFDIAILLNVTPDHLYRHGGMDGYVAAKANIFRTHPEKAQTFILGVDDAYTAALADKLDKTGAKIIRISGKRRIENGVFAEDGALWMGGDKILSLSSLSALPGAHNAENAAAAFAAATALGVGREAIIAGLHSFPGLAHRQQLVATLGGVRFVNDSKATNADATSKALTCYDAIYWIVGGRPKEGGLSGLEDFMPRIRHAFVIGEAEADFAAFLSGKASFTRCGTMDRALDLAASMALSEKVPGAVVLLSPACASWDQFSSFEERGDKFAAQVRDLAAGAKR
jgi:UDP-N-acetylmuramoylalanine--D-glutamate ligase